MEKVAEKKEVKKIKDEELKQLQSLQSDFTMLKNQLADAELAKYQVLTNIDKVKDSFIQLELTLIEKYGKDASINIQTGEITPKKDGKDK